MKKILCAENILCVLFIPVLFFMFKCISDMTLFSGVAVLAAVLTVLWIICFFFRKKIYEKFREYAWGFEYKALLIYFLAVVTAVKYKGIICADGNIISVLGAGILLGCCVLVFMKGVTYILHGISRLKIERSDMIFIIVLYILLNLELVIYCRYMKHIFVWDNAGYFLTTDRLNGIFPSREYIKTVFRSISETDYNYVIIFFSGVFRKLFGNSRYVYLASIVNCFLAPIIVILHLTAKKLFNTNIFHTVCMILVFPYLIFAANTGFIDIGGVIFTTIPLVIFLYSDRPEAAFVAGVCAAISVIMRRWYSFFALSLVITCFLYELPQKKCMKSLFLSAGFGLFLFIFFRNFVVGKLMADYKDMYSAYSFGIKSDWFLFVRYYGIIAVGVLVIYAFFKQLTTKKKYIMTKPMFLIIQSLICFFAFTYVQTHGQQHLALYSASFCLLFMMMCGDMIKSRKSACAAVLALGIMQTGNTFVLRENPKTISELHNNSLLTDFSSYPQTDENADAILEMNEYIDREIGEKGYTACILASSLDLNYETVMNAEISLSVKPSSDIVRSDYFKPLSDVDKRDGLSSVLFSTDYILVPLPVQTHLNPDDQKVITVPHKMITEHIGFGQAYEKQDKEFVLSDGTMIELYKRTREITDDEKQEVIKLTGGMYYDFGN